MCVWCLLSPRRHSEDYSEDYGEDGKHGQGHPVALQVGSNLYSGEWIHLSSSGWHLIGYAVCLLSWRWGDPRGKHPHRYSTLQRNLCVVFMKLHEHFMKLHVHEPFWSHSKNCFMAVLEVVHESVHELLITTVEPLYKGHHRGMKFWPL